ncbi:MAG: HAMP domain-containing protein [Chloroflexi bacterium]|nr:HAMP domain-containing protein [Chloroflexota bacterium]
MATMKVMATSQAKSPLINLQWRPLQRLLSFFRRLQWKLTLAYTLFTVITILILGIVGVGLLWYLYFWSNWLPNQIADGLLKAGPSLLPYLERTPPDQVGLNNWLQKVVLDENLVINIPNEYSEDKQDKIPTDFGRLVSIAIVDPEGKVLAAAPAETIPLGSALQPHLLSEAIAGFQAALRGETDPAKLAIRHTNGHTIAAAPIFDSNKQVVGTIFVELALPFEAGEFLQIVFQETILPVAIAMLVVGLIAGVLFGFFIARSLTRRLRALDEVADEWGRGNFEALARDTSGDELGHLARQLNHMALQLQNLLQTRQELATLEERNRLARDLHDSVKQQFFATAMQIGAAQELLPQQPTAAQTHLGEAERLAQQAQQELTTLIRQLRPAALEGKGLAVALRDYVADWARQNEITAEVRVQGERPLLLAVEQTLFRVAQEAAGLHSSSSYSDHLRQWAGVSSGYN